MDIRPLCDFIDSLSTARARKKTHAQWGPCILVFTHTHAHHKSSKMKLSVSAHSLMITDWGESPTRKERSVKSCCDVSCASVFPLHESKPYFLISSPVRCPNLSLRCWTIDRGTSVSWYMYSIFYLSRVYRKKGTSVSQISRIINLDKSYISRDTGEEERRRKERATIVIFLLLSSPSLKTDNGVAPQPRRLWSVQSEFTVSLSWDWTAPWLFIVYFYILTV